MTAPRGVSNQHASIYRHPFVVQVLPLKGNQCKQWNPSLSQPHNFQTQENFTSCKPWLFLLLYVSAPLVLLHKLKNHTIVWDLQRDSTILPLRNITPGEILFRIILQPPQLPPQNGEGRRIFLWEFFFQPAIFQLGTHITIGKRNAQLPYFLSNNKPSASKLKGPERLDYPCRY